MCVGGYMYSVVKRKIYWINWRCALKTIYTTMSSCHIYSFFHSCSLGIIQISSSSKHHIAVVSLNYTKSQMHGKSSPYFSNFNSFI